MKTTRKYLLLVVLALFGLRVQAQVTVNIRILPPYPTKITDYSSQPQLMVISVHNDSQDRLEIQLRGAITGDNGVELRVKPTYRSRVSIPLGPGETRSLNGNDLSYFFDYSQLIYKGITQNEFINKNGLPEGSYQFCLRAYDYKSNAPLSSDEPVGCSNVFTISSIEPPVILNPIDRDTLTNSQAFIMRWNTPGTTKPNIRYRIRMVEVFGNKNPNNAMLSSVQPPFFEKEVMGNAYVYNPGDPQLTPGRTYALMVQSFDPMNQTPFRNNGRSEVISFTYKKSNMGMPPLPPLGQPNAPLPIIATIPNSGPVTEPQCSCQAIVPTGTNANNTVQANTTQIKVNNFTMKVATLQKQADGKLSGTGTVAMPFIGSMPGASLRVNFSNLNVIQTQQGQPLVMTGGNVEGIVSGQAIGFTPPAGEPMALSPDKLDNIENYLKNTTDHLLSNVKNSASSVGFELPLSLNTGPVNVGIMRVHFTAKQAWFDAAAVVNIPDGNNMKLGLAGKDICMLPDNLCGQGTMYLSDDLVVSEIGITLKKHLETNAGSGTSISFDKHGFKSLHIDAEYQFPDGTLVKTDGGTAAKLYIKTDTEKGWGDWIGYATVDPFNINGLADFKFMMTGDNPAQNEQIVYDHSYTRNADNMPAQISSGDGQTINTSSPTWEGLFIPVLKVQLPTAIKSINNQTLTIRASNMIFEDGFTGFISSHNPLTLSNGSMGGWFFSIDDIGISFFKNSLTSGKMTGKLILPPSGGDTTDVNNRLDYSCNLSAPGGNTKFEFEIHPRTGLKFAALWANVDVAPTSNITVTAGGIDGFKATATLNGSMTIKPNNIDKLSNLTLGYMTFQDMIFSSNNGFSPGNFNVGLGTPPSNGAISSDGVTYAMDSPHGPNAFNVDDAPAPLLNGQQSLLGFNFNIDSIKPYMQQNKIGITFFTRMQLVNNVNFIPKAALDFSVFANMNAGTGGRTWWKALGGDINRVHLEADADLAGLKLIGSIDYFNSPAAGGSGTDRGFAGKLDVLLPGFGMNFGMKGMFGSRVNGANSFQFFYIDAMFDMGKTGIMMFPSTALYGFAGGAYYNMERSNETIYNTANSKMPESNDASYVSMKSFSGITYTPKNSQGSTFGFMAGVYFGLQSRETFEGELAFGMQFHNGALNEVSLDGRGDFFNDGQGTFEQRYAKAMGQMNVGIRVQFNDNHFWKFVAHAGAAMRYPPVSPVFKASGDTELYIENTSANDNATEQDGVIWYFKAGVPWGSAQGQPLNAQFDAKIFKIGAKAYFEVGNYNIDEIPEIPTKITNIINGGKSGVDIDNHFDGQAALEIPGKERPNGSQSGMIMGAMVEFEADPTFAIFYAHLYAGVGSDLSLKFYDQGKGQAACATSNSSWYARGDAFIGVDASCGVRVNVFGIKKNIEFVSAGVAAIVQAGGPDPLFASGTMGGSFAVLDGLISGRFSISFTVGQKCTAPTTTDQLKLISQLTPSVDGGEQTIFTRPAASFNFPLTSDFILTLLDEKTGAKTYTLFRFSKDYITADITGGSQHFTAANLKFPWGGDFNEQDRSIYRKDYSLSLNTRAASLLPLTKYDFALKAKIKKISIAGVGGIGKEVLQPMMNKADQSSFQWVMDGNKVYEDTRTTSFTTDKGPKNIPIDIVSELLPYHRESEMPMNTLNSVSNGYGRIRLIYPMTPENFDLKVTNPRAFARLVKADQGNATVLDIPVEIIEGGAIWQFKMPPLTPSSTYAIKIFLRGDAIASTSPTQLVSRTMYANLTYKVSDRQLVTNALTLKANEQEMLAWYFRTGSASSYQSKFSSMQLTKMAIGDKEADINKPATVNLQAFNWGPNEATKTINSIGVSYYFKASEAFNKMDVNDQVRNVVLPASSNFIDKYIWDRMMMRAGLEPWSNNVGDIQPIADRFAAVAFGTGKKLIIKMNTTQWNPTIGGVSTRENVEFPRLSGILAPNQYGVDFKSNNYGTPADPSGREDASGNSSTGNTTSGSKQGGSKVISPASNLIRGINLGTIQGTANLNVPGYSVANNHSDYILSYGLGYDAGVGVVEVGNTIIKNVIQQKKDLGYPADIFMDLPGFGAAMDGMQTNGQMGSASMNIAPAGGVKAPQIKVIAPTKLNQR